MTMHRQGGHGRDCTPPGFRRVQGLHIALRRQRRRGEGEMRGWGGGTREVSIRTMRKESGWSL